MNTGARVRGAASPQDALAAVADGLDALWQEIQDLKADKPADPWGEWNSPEKHKVVEDELRSATAEYRIQALTEKLEAADGEERRALEAQLRLAKDDLKSVRAIEERDAGERADVEIKNANGDTQVSLPVVSEEKQAQRRRFAEEILRLTDEYGHADILDHYAKGGPLLLYYSDRDFVMGLPPDTRRAMVQDVSEESPTEALEMGRDVLKDQGPGTNSMERMLEDNARLT